MTAPTRCLNSKVSPRSTAIDSWCCNPILPPYLVIQTILELGNQVLANMGHEEPINDVSIFFTDQFYIQFFKGAFPDIDFNSLEEAQNEEEMADNIQALIDLLAEEILKYDLDHIKGEEIVAGNPEHCINLLQLAKEVSLII